MKYLVLGFALVTLAPASGAQATSGSGCQALSAAVDDSEKELSSLTVENLFETSAPRATVQSQKMTVQLELIRANLALMEQNHCAPRKEPISTVGYIAAALECATEREKRAKESPKCKRESWERTAPAAKQP